MLRILLDVSTVLLGRQEQVVIARGRTVVARHVVAVPAIPEWTEGGVDDASRAQHAIQLTQRARKIAHVLKHGIGRNDVEAHRRELTDVEQICLAEIDPYRGLA